MARASASTSIQKVCAVLRTLSQRSPQRLTEIARGVSLNKTTALRILGELTSEGFVQRTANSKSYELGGELRAMAVQTRRPVDIVELAQPSLLRLAEKSADTALLSIRREMEALYIARAVGTHPLQPSYINVGSRRLLGVGAGSLALLGWLPDAEMNTIIDIVVSRQQTGSRITRNYLKERIRVARKCGYTLLIDAAIRGMGGIGVPVRDENGDVVAALSIGAASDRIVSRESMLSSALLQEARLISRGIADRQAAARRPR